MGNSAYKRREAEEFNEARARRIKSAAELAQDKIDNPEKYKRRPRGYGMPRRSLFASTPMSAVTVVKEEPVDIIDWIELSEVPANEHYWLDITVEDGNGWIREVKTNETCMYLSTHTFYGNNHEYSTRKLQEYGFNVVLDNWDKEPLTNAFELLTDDPAEIEEYKLRSKMMDTTVDLIESMKWSLDEAADHFDVEESRITSILNGEINKFTADDLADMFLASMKSRGLYAGEV